MDADLLFSHVGNFSLPNVCVEGLRGCLIQMNFPSNGSGSGEKNSSDNGTKSVESEEEDCPDSIPTSSQLFHAMPQSGYILIGFLVITTCLTIANYLEEFHFIMKNFRRGPRKRKTTWILAFFPVFSTTGLLGVLVPRSGTIVDMAANVYFGTCLYNFGRLMVDYMGGAKRMWLMIEDREMSMNTPPCCCCCVCLPKIKFQRKVFYKITLQIMQVAVVRPILMFLAAVLWTNGSYHPGNMSPYNGYLYVTVINLISTFVAVYGLMLMRGVLKPELEAQFSITGKIISLQLTLLSSSIPNLIISILVSTGVIECSTLFPSKSRGEAIYHTFLVLMMFPFSLLGRKFYRRKQDGSGYAQPQPGSKRFNELTVIDQQPVSKSFDADHAEADHGYPVKEPPSHSDDEN